MKKHIANYLHTYRLQIFASAVVFVGVVVGAIDSSIAAQGLVFALFGGGGDGGGGSDAGGGWGEPDCPNGAVNCINCTSPPSPPAPTSSSSSSSCGSCSSSSSSSSCRSLVVTYLHRTSGRWVHVDTIEPRYARPSTVAIALPANAFDADGSARMRISATKRHKVSGIAFVNAASAQERKMQTLELQSARLERTNADCRDVLSTPFDGRYVESGPGDVLSLAFGGNDAHTQYKLQIKEIEPELSAYDHIALHRVPVASGEHLVVRSDFSAPLIFKQQALVSDARTVGLSVRDNYYTDVTYRLQHRYLQEETECAGEVDMAQGSYLEIALTGANAKEGGFLFLESWYRDWTLGDIYEREGVAAFQYMKSPFVSKNVRRGVLTGILGSILGLFGASSAADGGASGTHTLANAFSAPVAHADDSSCASCSSCNSCSTSTPFVYTWDGSKYVMDNDVMFGKPISRFDSLAAGKKAYEARKMTPDLYALQNTIVAENGESDGSAYLLSFGGVYTYASRAEQQRFGKWTESLDDQALSMLSEVYHHSRA